MWSELVHLNVLPLLGYMIEGSYPSLVSEWMEKGLLRSRMTKLLTTELFFMVQRFAVRYEILTDNFLCSPLVLRVGWLTYILGMSYTRILSR